MSAEWIKWSGGECPVAADTLVEIKCRCGDQNGAWPAGMWSEGKSDWWKHEPTVCSGHLNDIIAYRVVPASVTPAPMFTFSADAETTLPL